MARVLWFAGLFVLLVANPVFGYGSGWYGQQSNYENAPFYQRLLQSLFKAKESAPTEDEPTDTKSWLFAFHLWSYDRFERLDENGNFHGFQVDIVNAVCKVANKNCNIMYDMVENCNLHKKGVQKGLWMQAGQGIMGGWYDACVGYFNVSSRRPVLDFTKPFVKYPEERNSLYVAKGNPNNFDPSNIAGKKIGFVEGIAYDASCLRDKANMEIDSNKEIYGDISKLIKSLGDGELDAIFTALYIVKTSGLEDQVESIGPEMFCTKDAEDPELHIVTRKGNPLRLWWDEAFQQLVDSGQYYKICQEATNKHGGEFVCV